MEPAFAAACAIVAVATIIAASRGRNPHASPRDPDDAPKGGPTVAVRSTLMPPIFEFRVALHALPGETRGQAASRLLRTVIAGIRDDGPQPFHFGIDDPTGARREFAAGESPLPPRPAAVTDEELASAARSLDDEGAHEAATEVRGQRLTLPREPVPMLLSCPLCHARHIDEGPHATRPHKTRSQGRSE